MKTMQAEKYFYYKNIKINELEMKSAWRSQTINITFA